jgi:hypothetical protein
MMISIKWKITTVGAIVVPDMPELLIVCLIFLRLLK